MSRPGAASPPQSAGTCKSGRFGRGGTQASSRCGGAGIPGQSRACLASSGPGGPAWLWQVSEGASRPRWTRGSPAPAVRLLPQRAGRVRPSGGPPRSLLLAQHQPASGFILKHLPGTQVFSAFALAQSSAPCALGFQVTCFSGVWVPDCVRCSQHPARCVFETTRKLRRHSWLPASAWDSQGNCMVGPGGSTFPRCWTWR